MQKKYNIIIMEFFCELILMVQEFSIICFYVHQSEYRLTITDEHFQCDESKPTIRRNVS